MISNIQVGNITINDNANYYLSELQGLEMPSVRLISYDLAGEHFAIFSSAYYGKRAFSIRGYIVASTIAGLVTARDAFQQAFDISSGELTVKFNLATGRTVQITAITAKLDITPRAGDVNAMQFSVNMVASFPFLLSQTESSQALGLATKGGAKVPPDTMPASLGADTGGSVVLSNQGNGVSYPRIRINGPVTNPQVTNLTTGKFIRLVMTLLSGEYVDLDFRRKTVIDNYSTNRYSAKSGDWWHLQPGANTIRFTADAYDALASMTIYSRDSWLGI